MVLGSTVGVPGSDNRGKIFKFWMEYLGFGIGYQGLDTFVYQGQSLLTAKPTPNLGAPEGTNHRRAVALEPLKHV